MIQLGKLRLGALGAAALLVLTVSLPAMASLDNELDLAAQVVHDSVLRLDKETDPKRRAAILRPALGAMDVLDSMAAGAIDSERARSALRDLASQAITPDVLRLSFVEVLAEGITKSDDTLSNDVEAKAELLKITDPAYRSAGWTALARRHIALGHATEAEHLATRAIEDAREIDRPATRNGALRASALIFAPKETPPAIVSTATDAMSSADARAETYHVVAQTAIKAQGASLKEGDLAKASEQFFSGKDLQSALTAAQALTEATGTKQVLLTRIAAAGVEAGDDAIALEAAKSMATDKQQDDALKRVILSRIASGAPLRANEIAPLMIRPNARTDAQVAVAEKLGDMGYTQAGIDLLKAIPPQEDKGAAKIVAGLAELSDFDAAQALAAKLTDGRARSFAFSRLAKRLSDAGRIDDARRNLEFISEAPDSSFALTGIARALAKSGDIEGATKLVPQLMSDDDRVRVWEAVGRAQADAGRIEEARKVADAIQVPLARSRVLVSIARALSENDQSQAEQALEKALEDLSAGNVGAENDTGEELADIAVAFAGLGKVDRSNEVLQRVTDRAIRDDAQERIAKILVKQGALDEARARASVVAGDPVRSEILAAVALGVFQAGGDVNQLVTDLQPLPYRQRVETMRAMTEIRARKLDQTGWLSDASAPPVRPSMRKNPGRDVSFVSGKHLVQAPAPATMTATGLRMPDIFALNAGRLRAEAPAPSQGKAHLASLGFSPFDLEAFKLPSDAKLAMAQAPAAHYVTWPNYIAVESGVMTISQLIRDLPEATTLDLLRVTGDRVLVRAPIIVMPGATLLISGAEFAEYRLSATAGAFIATAGQLVIQDAEIVGYDEVSNKPAVASFDTATQFRPYITAWGGSDIKIAGSRLAMLGYELNKAFGLTLSSGAAIQNYSMDAARPTGQIVDNSFQNMRSGYYGHEAENVQLVGNEYQDNIVYGIDAHDRSRGLLIALNTAYASQEKHGVIVSREVNDSFIVGNVSLRNKGSGLVLDRMSNGNVVFANTAIQNEGDGLTFYESGCNIAASNEVTDNARAGIKVRNSAMVGLYDNMIANNEGSGADIYVSDLMTAPEGEARNFEMDPYRPVSTTALGGNSFVANRIGINVAGASEIILDGNRFEDQRNRIFSGDLQQLSPYLLLIGDRSALVVSMACQPREEIDACKFGAWALEHQPPAVCTGMSLPSKAGSTTPETSNG